MLWLAHHGYDSYTQTLNGEIEIHTILKYINLFFIQYKQINWGSNVLVIKISKTCCLYIYVFTDGSFQSYYSFAMSAILKQIKTKFYILHDVGLHRDHYNESICQVSKLYLKLFLIKNSYKITNFTLGPLS